MQYHQPNVWWLPPASDYCQALFRCLNCTQRFDYDVLGNGGKLRGAAKHLTEDGKKRTLAWALSFRARMFLKGAVMNINGFGKLVKHYLECILFLVRLKYYYFLAQGKLLVSFPLLILSMYVLVPGDGNLISPKFKRSYAQGTALGVGGGGGRYAWCISDRLQLNQKPIRTI